MEANNTLVLRRHMDGVDDVGDDPALLSTQEKYIFLSLCMVLIWFGLWLTAKMRAYGIVSFPESAVLLIIGILTHLLLRALSAGNPMIAVVDSLLAFNDDFFFAVLLPPIIFEAGYGLSQASFFGNIGLVCNLAFLGTFLTMIFTGLMCWSWSNLPGTVAYPMDLLNSMVFGAIVSATDPVAVLVAFSQLGVDPVIYAAVFGEAVLNDAVAIVFYQTLVGFVNPTTGDGDSSGGFATYGMAFGQFVLIFVGSTVLGCVFGMLICLFYKHVHFAESARRVELALMLVLPYLSYFIAQAMMFSGIVAIMFCGIVVSRYGVPSFSSQCAAFVHDVYGAISQAFEAFIFLYLGVSFGSFQDADPKDLTFSLIALVAVFVARIGHVIISVALSNLLRPRSRAINIKGTAMLAFAGLRGPMAFALSVSAQQTLGDAGRVMNTATIIVITATTFIIGCLTPTLILKMGLTKPGTGSSGGWCGSCSDHSSHRLQSVRRESGGSSLTASTTTQIIPDEEMAVEVEDEVGLSHPSPQNWFTKLENQFIRPFLMTSSDSSIVINGIGDDVDTRLRGEDEENTAMEERRRNGNHPQDIDEEEEQKGPKKKKPLRKGPTITQMGSIPAIPAASHQRYEFPPPSTEAALGRSNELSEGEGSQGDDDDESVAVASPAVSPSRRKNAKGPSQAV